MKKINWPRLAVIVWFFAFGTGVWADMPNPINLSNVLAVEISKYLELKMKKVA